MENKTAAIVTMSDSASQGLREDIGGATVRQILTDAGFVVLYTEIVPDERQMIVSTLRRLCAMKEVRLIVTTGGTGIGPRDVTPEATMDVIERTLPGMAEAMRMAGMQKTPFAMTSRQVVGVCQNSLIINLPGSVKAVAEGLQVLLPVLPHTLDILAGHTEHEESKQNR